MNKILTLVLTVFALVVAAENKPNIIFVMVDDMGWGDLGCFYQNGVIGTKKHATPNLDTLASDGIQLRQHYCGAPVCAPSRASFLLGVHQGHANVRDNQFDKALEDNHTVGSVMRSSGYSTAMIGKYGLQGSGDSSVTWPAYPTKRGFDFYYGYVRHADGHQHYPGNTYPLGDTTVHCSPKEVWENDTEVSAGLDKCYTADLFTARAKKWIVDHCNETPGQPFFLFLAYDTPHASLQLPTQAYPSGGGLSGGLQWLGAVSNMINTASGTIDSWRHPDYVGQGWTDGEERFATSIRRIDSCIGDLRQTLADLNISTNTLFVFTSDNGPHNESYITGVSYAPNAFDSFGIFDGIKRDTWEGGIRVPTLAAWPGMIPSGGINSTPSQFHDWMPTFLDAAGMVPPEKTDGVSLLPTLTGSGIQRTPLTYVEYYNNSSTPTYSEFDQSHRGRTRNQMQVIFEQGYKGVRYNILGQDDDFEIYDLSSDPKETNNLAAAMETLQQRMKDRVLEVRMTDSSAVRPYDTVQIPSAGAGGSNGLHCAVYEGSWPWVPDFAEIVAVSNAAASGLDLSIRTRDDNIGMDFSGYIGIPESGEYTFYMDSDSGSMLRIHDALVVDNDYSHDGTERSGTILLKKGLHPVTLSYIHTNGVHSLDLQYSSSSISKQAVPVSAYFLDATGMVVEVQGDYVWGGAGSVAAPANWDDSSLNADPTHWGRVSAPDLSADTVLIPAGGIQRSSSGISISSTGSVSVTGGYLYLGSGITVNNASASFCVDGGQVNAQYITPYVNGTIEIASGVLLLRGADKPFAVASTGYLNFTGNSGVYALPNKNRQYIVDLLTAGDVRIDDQTVTGTGPGNAVNDRYFNNGVETSLVLVKAKTFQQQVLAVTNPVMYLMFEEKSTASHALDTSGYANHGSNNQGASFGLEGITGGCAGFDGSSWLVTDLTMDPNTNMTLEIVVKFNHVASQQDMFSQKDSGGTGRSIFYPVSDGYLRSYLGGKTTQSNLKVEAGKWYHLVLLVEENGSSDNISFYVNGEADLNAGSANIESNYGKWVVGSHKNNTSSFVNGLIDDVAVYDRLLTESEILDHYWASHVCIPGTVLILK